jgi:hypothetical protein
MAREEKITFGEMRQSGGRRIVVYCSDYKCSHSVIWMQIPGRIASGFPTLREGSFARLAASAAPMYGQAIRPSHGTLMKYAGNRPYSDPEKAARRLLEHARAFQPTQDGRIYIEQINHPFLFGDKATPAEYSAGLAHAISHGWLELHESGTFVKLTQSGASLFA